MRKLWVVPKLNSGKSVPFQLGVILFLVVSALLLQRVVGQIVSQSNINQAELIEHLRTQGMQPTILGTAYAPLAIRGQQIEVRDTATAEVTKLQIYDVSAQQATIDQGTIATVSSDGAVSVDIGSWHVPLVVFRHGDVLVLCFGRDEEVINTLTRILGPSVAQSQI
jgi:hypothetical protein